MGDVLGSLVWGAKSGQYCVIGGGSLHVGYAPGHDSVNPYETRGIRDPDERADGVRLIHGTIDKR